MPVHAAGSPFRTQLDQAAHWIVSLRRADVPSDVLELAQAQRINILAAIFAGARTAFGQRATAAADAFDDGGSVISLPDGKPRSLHSAAWLGAVLGTALELDDFVFAGHTGQAAVTTSLMLGQAVGASGEETLLAQIVANEVAGRLGAVMTAGPQHGHMKAYLNRAATVAAAARLLRFDATTTARALAIALSAPEYPLFHGAFSADTKALCTGDPVVAGLRAARLAETGIDAATDIVEHAGGLVRALSNHDRVPPIWDRLGSTWSTQAICFKPLSACAYACAAAAAAAAIVTREGDRWDPASVRRVDVATTVLTLTMEGLSEPHRAGYVTEVNTNFSTRRSVALTLLAGTPTGDHFVPERFAQLRDAIATMSGRVHLRHDWPLTMQLLHGVDAAIDHPGRPGIYGMVETHRTLGRFKAAFRTPAAVSARDLPAILAMPREEAWYLLRRYAIGLRSRLPFREGQAARDAYVARETDLRRMALRFGARVRVELRDGRTLQEEVVTPPGFAGDPERLAIPPRKFRREVGAAVSAEYAEQLLALLERLPPASPTEVASAMTSEVSHV